MELAVILLNSKYLLVLLSFLLTLAGLEIFLRCFGPHYTKFGILSHEYYTNPRNYYNFLHYDTEGQSVYGLRYYWSATYMRIPDSINHKLNQYKAKSILGLGDSFTFGQGVRYEDIYLTRLGKLLKDQYYIQNRGVCGADIETIYCIFTQTYTLQKYEFVIYGFVLNDFGLPGEIFKGNNLIDFNISNINNINEKIYDVWRVRSRLYNFIMHRLELKEISQKTVQTYRHAFDNGHETTIKLNLIKQMHNMTAEQGGQFILIIFPLLWELDDYPFVPIHQLLKDFCNQNQIKVLDLLPFFQKRKTQALWAAPSDHHPNEIAHKIAAQAILKYMGAFCQSE